MQSRTKLALKYSGSGLFESGQCTGVQEEQVAVHTSHPQSLYPAVFPEQQEVPTPYPRGFNEPVYTVGLNVSS